MLLDLPVELLLSILKHLPVCDITTCHRTSRCSTSLSTRMNLPCIGRQQRIQVCNLFHMSMSCSQAFSPLAGIQNGFSVKHVTGGSYVCRALSHIFGHLNEHPKVAGLVRFVQVGLVRRLRGSGVTKRGYRSIPTSIGSRSTKNGDFSSPLINSAVIDLYTTYSYPPNQHL